MTIIAIIFINMYYDLKESPRILMENKSVQVNQVIFVESQSINTPELVRMIQSTLDYLGLNSPEAVQILLHTAAVETDFGKKYKQTKGPALGIFQMEPTTEKSIWQTYLGRSENIHLANKIKALRTNNPKLSDMQYNLAYQIAMARCYYLSKPGKLPAVNDKNGIYAYYKKYWNTYKGASTKEKSLMKFNKYITTTEVRVASK